MFPKSTNLILAIFGVKTIRDVLRGFLKSDLSGILGIHADYLLDILKNKNYPTSIDYRYSYYELEKSKNVELKKSLILPDYIDHGGFASLTSMLSIYERFRSGNINKPSPIEHLETGNNFPYVMNCIYNSVVASGVEDPIEVMKTNIVSLLAQYYHDMKLLVNSFHPSRVYALLHQRIVDAETLISDGAPIADIVERVAFIDPSSGWGCRLSAALVIHVYLRDLIIESGNYSESSIEDFKNSLCYVGFDTNTEMAPIYRKVVDLFSIRYGINSEIVKFHMIDYTSNAASTRLKEYSHINVYLTSSPTLLEFYPRYDNILTNHSIIKNKYGWDCRKWKNWVDGFLVDGIYVQSCRNTKFDGKNPKLMFNVIDNCRIPCTDGKSRLIPLTDHLITKLNASSLFKQTQLLHFTWEDIAPIADCPKCKANDAIDCGECTNCNRKYKKIGCTQRKNACDTCCKSASLRTVVCTEFVNPNV